MAGASRIPQIGDDDEHGGMLQWQRAPAQFALDVPNEHLPDFRFIVPRRPPSLGVPLRR